MFNETLKGFSNHGLYNSLLFIHDAPTIYIYGNEKMKYYRKAVSFYTTVVPYRLANVRKPNNIFEFFLL